MRKGTRAALGGLLLLSGLFIALVANHYEVGMVTPVVRSGARLPAPEPGSPDLAGAQRLRTEVEWLFWIGLALAEAGVVCQILSWHEAGQD